MNTVQEDLKKLANPVKAKILSRFFKTGPGEYGEGDIFLGVQIPQTREVAKKYYNIPFKDVVTLLKSKIHEERQAALLLLVHRYDIGSEIEKENVYIFYLKNTKYINNWDLVDLSADKIIGKHLMEKPKKILYELAKSNNLWERRISIISTFHFIRNNRFDDTLKISEILLSDKHDLIQKAVGWMLREIGKRNQETEEIFLRKHYRSMHRTTLRYAIERFPRDKQRFYLNGPKGI